MSRTKLSCYACYTCSCDATRAVVMLHMQFLRYTCSCYATRAVVLLHVQLWCYTCSCDATRAVVLLHVQLWCYTWYYMWCYTCWGLVGVIFQKSWYWWSNILLLEEDWNWFILNYKKSLTLFHEGRLPGKKSSSSIVLQHFIHERHPNLLCNFIWQPLLISNCMANVSGIKQQFF